MGPDRLRVLGPACEVQSLMKRVKALDAGIVMIEVLTEYRLSG
jgi:hypothetical protein